jgi:hypothetical protein
MFLTPRKNKVGYNQANFYEEILRVLDKQNMLHLLLKQVKKKSIFRPTENESLKEMGNDNGAGVIKFVISKNFTVKSAKFTNCIINTFIEHFQIKRLKIKLTIFCYIADII